MILTVAFANDRVMNDSYRRLFYTSFDEVWLWDNHYPGADAKRIANRYHFKYFSLGENIGLYEAHNKMLDVLPHYVDKVIMYDSDNYPMMHDWDVALKEVIGGDVVHSTLSNPVSNREMEERGYTSKVINGLRCKIPHQVCTNTTCAFSVEFLRECGGLIGGKKYYGGNEIAMKGFYKGKHWVFLEDFFEDSRHLKPYHDWQYEQYKLLYAHRHLNLSYDEYLKTDPERIDDLAKQIFG